MLYDIGLFCIILAIVIGFSAIIFQLPKARARKLIMVLMISSAILITAGFMS